LVRIRPGRSYVGRYIPGIGSASNTSIEAPGIFKCG
jgi:hypothetical protein